MEPIVRPDSPATAARKSTATFEGWYNDMKAIRKMMTSSVPRQDDGHILHTGINANTCPSCSKPFDKGKKRKLIDACGHERCYTCVFGSDRCPLCTRNAVGDSPTNGSSSQLGCNMRNRGIFRRNERPNSISVDNSSTFSGEVNDSTNLSEPNDNYTASDGTKFCNNKPLPKMTRSTTIPETDSKHDFYMRIDLLAEENKSVGHSSSGTVRPPSSLRIFKAEPQRSITGDSISSPESYTSASSLSSGNDPRKVFSSSDTSPVSTLTGSSENSDPSLRRLGQNSSVSSIMSNNPTSITSSSSPSSQHIARNSGIHSPLFLRRGSNIRSSGGNRSALSIYSNKFAIPNHRVYGFRSPVSQLPLRPLFFEVPQCESDPLFIGREWLFKEVQQEIISDSQTNKGVIISGAPGTGKTSIILRLVDYSVFGRKREDTIYEESHSVCESISNNTYGSGATPNNSIYQSRLTLSQEVARSCGIHVVAYHFCQTENNVTCLVPDFVHSIGAQLCQAPQLAAYRELISRSPKYQEILSMTSCIQNASHAFTVGILDPLHSLRRLGKISNTACFIVIDALNEAEFHKPDYGSTITSFLSQHIHHFPQWLKLVVTVRTAFQEITRNFPFHRISLDRLSANENLQRDIFNYINFRINMNTAIRSNMSVNNTSNKSNHSVSSDDRASITGKFVSHLTSLSRGCMLYVKLILDQIEKGNLVLKSTNYKVLPVCLSEVFLLSFNLRFNSVNSYERVAPILQILSSSLYPLTQLEVYNTINAGAIEWANLITWDEFLIRLNCLTSSQFVVIRKDGTLMIAHSALREWLIRREENESSKFLLDPRIANALIAFRLSRFNAPLDADKCIELGHHILKAHLYKGFTYGDLNLGINVPPRDLQASWILFSSFDISSSLCSLRNMFCPNVKVTLLLLLAGACPDQRSPLPGKLPVIAIAAREGFNDMVSTLIDFGADIDATSCDEMAMNALHYASQMGHLEIVRLLIARGASLNQTDGKGRCALVLAAMNGHFEIVCHIVQCDWHDVNKGPTLTKAAQQAFVTAASYGHIDICDYLLDMAEVQVNAIDSILSSHTALSAACSSGRTKVCEMLLRRGASVSVLNLRGEPPLICAVSEGQWEVAELILSHVPDSIEQSDTNGKTPLIVASAEGHLGILELLLSNGANVLATDSEGMSALTWACVNRQIQAAQCLLVHGANVNHADSNGKVPLDYVALHGTAEMAQLLLEKGALLEHIDLAGIRPLDRAIGQGNIAVVSCFLKRGAKLGNQTWAMAEGKLDVLLLLLHKLMEDGSILYKKNCLRDASHRFQYALKKFPPSATTAISAHNSSFVQLKFHLYLGYSRCKRKMNEFESSIEAAEKAIELKPKSFEGYYSKGRTLKEMGRFHDAYKEITDALNIVSPHNDIRRVIMRLKYEIEARMRLGDVPNEDAFDIRKVNEHINKAPSNEINDDDNAIDIATVDRVCDELLSSLNLEDQKMFEEVS